LLLCIVLGIVSAVRAQDFGPQAPNPPASNVNPVFKLNRREPKPTPFPEEIRAQIQLFLQGLTRGPENFRIAFTQLLEGSRLGERKENVGMFTEKTQELVRLFGKVVDFEHFDTQKVGTRMLVLTYVTWHELYPVQWRFVYYRPGSKWKLIDLTFTSNPEDLIQ
jgi:hypothetical protein